ncbi:MAG: hypothetical protein AMXMBFR82_34070 [Candidatus Hydrogenedentota bacterium]
MGASLVHPVATPNATAQYNPAIKAFAGCDAAGASWFGYPTVWVNRLGAPPEALDAAVDVVGSGLEALLGLLDPG